MNPQARTYPLLLRTDSIRRRVTWLWLAFWVVVCAAGAAEPAPISTNSVAEAENIFGLNFSPSERQQMLPALEEQRAGFRALRRDSIPNALAPALVFDPLPHGFQWETRNEAPRWSRPTEVPSLPTDEELAFASVGELGVLLRQRRVTSEQLTRLALARLQRYGPGLHCVVTLLEARALAQARTADRELASGRDRGPLHGIPYGAKDLLAVKGFPTTWGATPYTNQMFDTDATVIQRLDEAGAVLVAKLSLGELAMGDIWFGGKTRNPWNPAQGSSGSSAGSASAVAAGLVPFALGSETLGSIVSPSTVCGTTGLRPTFGRVSRAGAMTLSWSCDKIGPIARTAEDCARVFDVLRGRDPLDPTTRDAPFNYDAARPLKDIRIGVLRADIESGTLNRTNNQATLDRLVALGARCETVRIPDFPMDPLMAIIHVEAAAAFDSLTRSGEDDRLAQQGPGSWPNIFRAARLIPAVEYLQANRMRTALIEAVNQALKDVDVLVAPAWEGNALFWSNFTGHPCVVVPNGIKTGSNPASITFLGKLYGEAAALEVANAYQSATTFHRQRPDLKAIPTP